MKKAWLVYLEKRNNLCRTRIKRSLRSENKGFIVPSEGTFTADEEGDLLLEHEKVVGGRKGGGPRREGKRVFLELVLSAEKRKEDGAKFKENGDSRKITRAEGNEKAACMVHRPKGTRQSQGTGDRSRGEESEGDRCQTSDRGNQAPWAREARLPKKKPQQQRGLL